ncbi:hypothetical protein BDW02DRAFT_606899 [Decorospora gaudefroyi]|uniref:Uncharacterized protein n=1 Tax=Decorospora gaudefroyi TaxID=184978 RepID=A0A6A5K3F8_9PLEO|nr:hypothetical protein BDW02DRAFT_606899 [Decorospora gaudefroyi]
MPLDPIRAAGCHGRGGQCAFRPLEAIESLYQPLLLGVFLHFLYIPPQPNSRSSLSLDFTPPLQLNVAQPGQPETARTQNGLAQSQELDVEKLWGDNISSRNWHPRIRNIRTMHNMKKLHECAFCGHGVTRLCYTKHFHLAYCTGVARNNRGVLDFHGELFNVQSAKGCDQHPFSAGHNKFYLTALKQFGTSGISQPRIPTEEQHRIMQDMNAISVHELEELQMAMNEAFEEPEDEQPNEEEDLEPWKRYTQPTEFKEKPPGREKTNPTQGKKLQPALTWKER